jgi:light-regulated signal transduction histidine kinase (bacteriophytochrome)
LSATIVYDREGKFLRSRSTIIDYTERRRIEIALRESRTTLEAVNKELEAFTYSVSHDLRAPLRAVDGFSQAVLEDFGPTLPAGGQHQLQVIRESARRMGQLIDDLLAFSRLGRSPLSRQTVDMDALVRSTLADLAPESAERQIAITVGELPPAHGDPALLKQVWVNLLSNALKYTRRRQRAVIEVGCTISPAHEKIYFVRDNGAGFDMHYAHKLFGVFQRLHRADEFEGSGVGLAIVQRVISRHGGRVWAESVPKQGATFYFTLEEKPRT